MVYRICACKSSIVLEIVVSELMTFTGNFSLKIPRSSEKTGVIEQKLPLILPLKFHSTFTNQSSPCNYITVSCVKNKCTGPIISSKLNTFCIINLGLSHPACTKLVAL